MPETLKSRKDLSVTLFNAHQTLIDFLCSYDFCFYLYWQMVGTQLHQIFKYIYIYLLLHESLIFFLIKTKHLYNPGYIILKLCNVLVTVQFAENQSGTWYLRSWTKYFRQTLDFMWKSELRENFNFSFSLIFCWH